MSGKPEDPFVKCPAFGYRIGRALCWEYALADRGGPADTAKALKAWIRRSEQFETLDDFHAICDHCRNRPWRDPPAKP
jgi:hypothetical protein